MSLYKIQKMSNSLLDVIVEIHNALNYIVNVFARGLFAMLIVPATNVKIKIKVNYVK